MIPTPAARADASPPNKFPFSRFVMTFSCVRAFDNLGSLEDPDPTAKGPIASSNPDIISFTVFDKTSAIISSDSQG